MRISIYLLLFLFLINYSVQAQEIPSQKKFKITGKVVDSGSKLALEYATITFKNRENPKVLAGGITNNKGEFNVDVAVGTYDITIEFISFKPSVINSKLLSDDTDLGLISLSEDATQLDAVVVRAENTTVQIKLDKKVYNVGQDLLVKGGTVSDVLDNIPSVSVDAEGVVSLRGNENVRILIDGRPSNAINITEALRLIPADAIEKVEVVTNPSARYDSEGGGGLLNIILKKGKNLGTNGTLIATVGDPENYGLSGNINYKTKDFNIFTTTGYNYRNNPGNGVNNTEYLQKTNDRFVDESRTNDRLRKGYNSNFGFDWFLSKSLVWTQQINLRRNNSEYRDLVSYDYYNQFRDFSRTEYRINNEDGISENVEYSTNITKNFNEEGHKLTIDGSFSKNKDIDDSVINGGAELNFDNQRQGRNIIQADYVLPFGKNNQFEAGYKGDFNKLITEYQVNTLNNAGLYEPNYRFTNTLQYNERVNALYTQFGTKINKFSVLLGLRYENSNIDINQLSTGDYNNKKYGNFFPSAFLTYEISDASSVSLSYSKRISRPRGRQINPFSNRSSDINIFKGNPDLNPAMTDAIDLGYLKRWTKLTLNTSLYFNKTADSFQYIRTNSGDFVNGIPVIYTMPVNLATEFRSGFEFTLNYSPFKWWKINSNFNLFRNEINGEYTFLNAQNIPVLDNLDNVAYSWFTRLTSKVTLPYKIEWQTNFTYNGAQKNAQGTSKGIASANAAFSKDLFKDKATVSLNVQDIFNSRKRIYETYLPEVSNSYSEMQWRTRQVNLSFTYRFNRKKNEREKQQRPQNDGGDDFQG